MKAEPVAKRLRSTRVRRGRSSLCDSGAVKGSNRMRCRVSKEDVDAKIQSVAKQRFISSSVNREKCLARIKFFGQAGQCFSFRLSGQTFCSLHMAEGERRYGIVTSPVPEDGLRELLRASERNAIRAARVFDDDAEGRQRRRAFHWYSRFAIWRSALEKSPRVRSGEVHSCDELNPNEIQPLLTHIDLYFNKNPQIRRSFGLAKDLGPGTVLEWFESPQTRCYNGSSGGKVFLMVLSCCISEGVGEGRC